MTASGTLGSLVEHLILPREELLSAQDCDDALNTIVGEGKCFSQKLIPVNGYVEARAHTTQYLENYRGSYNAVVSPFKTRSKWLKLILEEEGPLHRTAIKTALFDGLNRYLQSLLPYPNAWVWEGDDRGLEIAAINLGAITAPIRGSGGVRLTDPTELWAMRYLDSGCLYCADLIFGQLYMCDSTLTPDRIAIALRASFIFNDLQDVVSDLIHGEPGNIFWLLAANCTPVTASDVLSTVRADWLWLNQAPHDVVRRATCRMWLIGAAHALCNRRYRGYRYSQQLPQPSRDGCSDSPSRRRLWNWAIDSTNPDETNEKTTFKESLAEWLPEVKVLDDVRRAAMSDAELEKIYRHASDPIAGPIEEILAGIIWVLDVEGHAYDRLAFEADHCMSALTKVSIASVEV
ncbi:uncharacterized protein N7498_009927 [Penicillium cinerascens]|uniref:Uncharacterized protein n=1 Tax=Penicillium cinerascens TaxID=70096 RepID=A0A9W9M8F7_9EURO|nr:uncharacterized protein N7498_009927 [Penicillium cinerascens]KAJ5190942.1 hypothetical protein N7498_009927 [Penicillium cinerascens]